MAFEVIWTERSLKDLEKIIDYLIAIWGITVAEDFAMKVEDTEDFISNNANSGRQISKSKNIYRTRITKHNAFYYRLIDNKIEVITIFDTRQNPQKLKL